MEIGTRAVLCKFDRTLGRFAAVTADGRVRVWTASTGTLLTSFTPPAHLRSASVCMSWLSGSKTKSKKGVKALSDLIAIGSSSGKIVVWDTAKGEVRTEIDGGAAVGGALNDVAFNQADGSLWCGGDGPNLLMWSSSLSGAPARTLDVGAAGCVRLEVAQPHGAVVMVANRTYVSGWDVASSNILFRVAAHATAPRCLRSCFDSAVQLLVTSGAEERVMNVWQCDELGEKKSKSALRKPSHTLSCRSPPIACDVAYRPGRGSANGVGRKRKAGARDGVQERDACYYVLSIQPDRAVVFEVRLGVKGVSECTIQERGAGERRASGEGVMGENSFLFGQFVGTDSVVIVRGSLARPHFESVRFVRDDTGELLPTIELAKLSTNQVSEEVEKKKRAEVTVAPKRHKPRPMEMEVEDDDEDSAARSSVPSFAQQLESMGLLAPNEATNTAVAASSLQSVLQQALKSNDKDLLDQCLASTEKEVIANTMRRLPRASILPFLKVVVERLERYPRSAHNLMYWLQPLLTHHASFFISLHQNEVLGSLVQIIEARTALYTPMVKLNGRLDFLLSQIKAREEATSYDNFARLTEGEILSDSEGEEEDSLNDDDLSEIDDEFTSMALEDDDEDDDDEDDEDDEYASESDSE